MEFRIGNGFDVHRFDTEHEGTHIVLGGVKIFHPFNLLAHSDGDVLSHSLMDAMLGALSLGDIGKLFPDSNPDLKDADSISLLKKVNAIINRDNWRLHNCDLTIVAELPKIAPHTEDIISNLAAALEVEKNAVSVKATSTEKLGFTGRGEGIAVLASVLVARS